MMFSALRAASALTFVTALGAGTAAAQQQVVWPAQYANLAGESSLDTPFTLASAQARAGARSITAISASSAPFGVGSVIHEIAFRRDAIRSGAYGSRSGQVEIQIGAVDDADKVTAALHSLWSGEPTRVYSGTVNLPYSPPPSSGPAPFGIVFQLDQPWTYTGGDFAIDVLFTGAGGGAPWRRDAVRIPQGHSSRVRSLGPGCDGADGFVPVQSIDLSQAVPGGRLVSRVMALPRPANGGAAVALLGRGVGTVLLPTPAPLDALGFPAGCTLYTDPGLIEIRPTGDRSVLHSEAVASWSIPPDGRLAGLEFATQWIVVDFRLQSSTTATVSNALSTQIGVAAPPQPFFGRTIWAHGTTSLGQSAAARVSARNYVAVTRFGGSLVP